MARAKESMVSSLDRRTDLPDQRAQFGGVRFDIHEKLAERAP